MTRCEIVEATLVAFEELLSRVEGEVCGRAAYGYEITDPNHPWHEDVMNARAAVARAKATQEGDEPCRSS